MDKLNTVAHGFLACRSIHRLCPFLLLVPRAVLVSTVLPLVDASDVHFGGLLRHV